MTKKEMKNLAKQIAKLENIIKTSQDKEEIYAAEQQVMNLTSKVTDFDDMMEIDEMVLNILEKT